MNYKLISLLAVFSFLASCCIIAQPEKINGVSFVAPNKEIGKLEIEKPRSIVNSNYLSLMPYAFIPENGTELRYNSEWQWWGEKKNGTIFIINEAHKQGYKIMMKPHVWKKHGEYTGHHKYENEKDWLSFEKSYAKYILEFAKISDSLNVELFCIGTEWEKFALQRPNFWYNLILDIKAVYKGKLTYAANWDEYKRISFWKELDYIGVDAYFPLNDAITPNKNILKEALNPYKKGLKLISEKNNKPIIFTEFGYRSRDKTADKPWEADRNGNVNLDAQIIAYEAFFESLWKEKHIAGGFLWKWFPDYDNVGGENHNGFTPQNKPVEGLIKKWYSK